MKYKKHSAIVLERYLLNELPGNEIQEINRQLKEDPELKKEIEKLKNSNKEILKQYPPDSVIPQVLYRYNLEKKKEEIAGKSIARARPVLFRSLLYASPVAALLLVLLFLWLPLHKGNIDPAKIDNFPGDTRIKGSQAIDMTGPHLMIYRKTKDNVELLENGVTAKAGDLLQVAYAAGGETYGIILSMDGNGMVTLHYPEKKGGATLLKKEKKILLNNAYELDDAPAFERFFFITSKSAVDVEAVMRKAKALARDANRAKTGNIEFDGLSRQISILIIKGEES